MRHRDIEQDQIGLEHLDQAHRRIAVAGCPRHFDIGEPGADHLHPLDCERFIIDNQRAQCLSHIPA